MDGTTEVFEGAWPPFVGPWLLATCLYFRGVFAFAARGASCVGLVFFNGRSMYTNAVRAV